MAVTVPQSTTQRTDTDVNRHIAGALVVFLAVAALLPWPAALGGALTIVVLLAFGARGRRPPTPDVRAFGVACVTLLASSVVSAVFNPVGLSGLRAIGQFVVLAALALAFCVAPKTDTIVGAIWAGATAGAVIAGLTASINVGVLGSSRASGIGGHAIGFGNLALLMGVLSVVLAPFAGRGPIRLPERLISVGPAAAVLAGVLASALSGSRGGWLAAPVMALLVLTHQRRHGTSFPRGVASLAAATVLAGVAVGGGMPAQRLTEAPRDVSGYLTSQTDADAAGTTIGARFEAWRSAGEAFADNPIVGLGWGNLQQQFRDDVERGERHPRIAEFEHAHQQFLGALASGGVLGAAAMSAIVVVPMAFSRRARASGNARDRTLGSAGILMTTSYLIFGLTEGIMDNLAPVAFYAVVVGALASQVGQPDEEEANASRNRRSAVGAAANGPVTTVPRPDGPVHVRDSPPFGRGHPGQRLTTTWHRAR